MDQKSKIFRDIWCCAYQRKHQYKNTPREIGEHETLLMCMGISKWWKFDTEKPNYLE